MFSQDDDETEDTRRIRRSLEPLDIEDAEKPPSFVRRMAAFFRKKPAFGAEPEKSPEGIAPPEGSLPEDPDEIK